jgi:hypothetical protein
MWQADRELSYIGRDRIAPLQFLKNAGGLVYSQAAFFFGNCAGRRSNFFSSPSDCRCALSDFVRFFAMSIVCSAFVLNASAARQRW